MNEPEGSVDPTTVDPDQPCFDTSTVLGGSGAGWAGHRTTMQDLLAFFNRDAAAIHAADPTALVTVGSWSQYAATDAQGVGKPGTRFFNYYKDACLEAAGGHKASAGGGLDFYQVHTYAHGGGVFDVGSPFGTGVRSVQSYELDKPMVVGEFSAGSTKGKRGVAELYTTALQKGFAGAWDWSLLGGDGNDDEVVADAGMQALRHDPRVRLVLAEGGAGGGGGGAAVATTVAAATTATTCTCSDKAPPGSYSCKQQAGWGKCTAPFMKGFCCLSCHGCEHCS